ncbi:18170_t:CDS:2, partial [Funneliformis geosporum]
DIYGVLPFVAPEVLRGQPYSLAKLLAGITPFNNEAHDFKLALSICKGKRPKIIDNIPQCYISLIRKCWDKDPSKRPTALEIKKLIEN